MPLFSAFTKFGNGFCFSGKPSHGETIFRAMLSNIGSQVDSLSIAETTRMRAFCYAQAMMAARVLYTLEHAGYQLDPLKVCEMLPLRENEYGIVPGPNESIDDRRATLAARKLAPRGGSFNNIKTALASLVGDAFVQYVTTPYADAVVTPPNLGDQPMNLAPSNRLQKLLTITDAISTGLGAPQWVNYSQDELAAVPDAAGEPLQPLVGETFVIDAGHNVLHETVTITGLRELTPGAPEIEATFNNPHSAGTLCTNIPYPYWLSTKRFNLVVLTAATAADPETRRRINEQLERMVRAVSTWAIVQEDPAAPGHTGTFLADTSGSDTQTMEDVVIPP